MGIFVNDLDKYLVSVQTEEIIASRYERYEKHSKSLNLRICLNTGAIAGATASALIIDQPSATLLPIGSVLVVNAVLSLYSTYKSYKEEPKLDINNLHNMSAKEIARIKRQKERYRGKLEYISPANFHRPNAEIIEKPFGSPNDNDLPIHFIERELVATQVLEEYEMYNLKYELPELKITEEELNIFIDELEKFLKSKMLSHRIYFYTSEYIRRLLATGLINYWDDINIETLIEHINCFENLEYTEEELEGFKKLLRTKDEEYKNSKKLSK